MKKNKQSLLLRNKFIILAFLMALAEFLSIAIFGLNELAVRFPAALFGAMSVFLIFFAVREIFQDFEDKEIIGLLSGGILALSPWSFHYAHGAWELNLLLVLIFLAIIFFLKAEKKKIYSFYLSAVFFGLCFYVDSSAKLLIPLIILGLIFIFREKLKHFSYKNYLISLVILGILVLPVAKFTSIFSFPRNEDLSFQIFLGQYLNHFSPRFLFFENDWGNPRYRVPLAGVLNMMDILFLPLGIYFLISRKIKNFHFLWYLLLITPLPVALNQDIIKATRSFLMIIPLTVIGAFGIYFVWGKLKKIKNLSRFAIALVLVLGYLFSFIYHLDQFFTHAPK